MTTTSNESLSSPSIAEPPLDQQQQTQQEQAQLLIGQMSRHWGILLSIGIILAGLGVAVMAWPQQTIVVLAALLGISLLVSGVFSIVGSITMPDQQTTGRVLMAISGGLSILLGILTFGSITNAVAILALMVGIGWLVRGIFDVVTGISAKGVSGRGLVIAMGVLGILAGCAVLFWPAITLTALAWVSGIWLVAIGLIQIYAAFKLRGVAGTVPSDEQTVTA